MAMAAADSPAGRWGHEGEKAQMRDVGGRAGGRRAAGEEGDGDRTPRTQVANGGERAGYFLSDDPDW